MIISVSTVWILCKLFALGNWCSSATQVGQISASTKGHLEVLGFSSAARHRQLEIFYSLPSFRLPIIWEGLGRGEPFRCTYLPLMRHQSKQRRKEPSPRGSTIVAVTLKATKKNMSTQNQEQEEAVCVMPVRSGEDPVKEALNFRSESWEEFWLSWMKSDILRQIRLKVALYGGVWPDLYKNWRFQCHI